MSDLNQIKLSLANITTSVTSNKNIISEVQLDNKTIIELLNAIYQRVEDTSKKLDEVLNIGFKLPKQTKATDTSSEKKSTTASKNNDAVEDDVKQSDDGSKSVKNIMTYFKVKYLANPNNFNDIFEENQVAAIFAEHATDINGKKEGVQRDKIKVTLLYKKMSKDQKKKLREKMINENDSANVNNDADIVA